MSQIQLANPNGSGGGGSGTTLNGTVITTDDTPSNIIVFSPPDDKSFAVRVLVTGYDAVTPAAIGGELIGIGRKNSGVVTVVGTPDKTKDSDVSLGASDFNLVANASNLELQVIGVAATTIDWRAIVTYITAP